MLGGALWGGIAGVLKARTGAHEVITTIMLNYIAAGAPDLLLWARSLPAPGQRQHRSRRRSNDSATLPDARRPSHLGVLLALLAAVLVWWLLEPLAPSGFELRAVGANPDAARTAGMSVAASYTIAMLLAGALAGLAGRCSILGTKTR